MKEILEKDINILKLNNEIVDVLQKNKITKIESLANKSKTELKNLGLMGYQISEIELKLQLEGLDLNGKYKIKNRLYEIENCSEDLIRISKSCIININHVTSFDMGEKGRIAVKLDDGTKEIVSRRKIKEVINFLDERGI